MAAYVKWRFRVCEHAQMSRPRLQRAVTAEGTIAGRRRPSLRPSISSAEHEPANLRGRKPAAQINV